MLNLTNKILIYFFLLLCYSFGCKVMSCSCFQDYEEDFEDVGEEKDDKEEEEEEKQEDDNNVREKKRELSPRRREEIEAIQKAIDEENERIYTARSKPTTIESAITQRGS